jgi:hypothetical protein
MTVLPVFLRNGKKRWIAQFDALRCEDGHFIPGDVHAVPIHKNRALRAYVRCALAGGSRGVGVRRRW